MRIRELDCEDSGIEESRGREIVRVRTKRALVGAGARILFYPTLLYNVCRNKIQAEFRWWDQVDQVVSLPNFISHFLLICMLCLFSPFPFADWTCFIIWMKIEFFMCLQELIIVVIRFWFTLASGYLCAWCIYWKFIYKYSISFLLHSGSSFLVFLCASCCPFLFFFPLFPPFFFPLFKVLASTRGIANDRFHAHGLRSTSNKAQYSAIFLCHMWGCFQLLTYHNNKLNLSWDLYKRMI